MLVIIYSLAIISFSFAQNFQQIHLSVDENLNTIVTWSTMQSWPSVVRYSDSPSFSTQNIVPASETEFIDGGQARRTQYIHRAKLENLEEDKVYYYQCGDRTSWSNAYSFKTLRKDPNWAPKFIVYGDLGYANGQSIPRLIQETNSGNYDMLLHVGDFAYDFNDDNGQQGDRFMNAIEPFAAKVPYMATVGNHENTYNFSHFKNRFSMPGHSEGLFYSYNVGPVHFISFSTEVYYFTNFGYHQIWNQYRWLINDLKEANKPENRAKRPWIITLGHRPMYCSNSDFNDCVFYLWQRIRIGYGWPLFSWYGLEDPFYKYGVDLEIYAHEHSYQRTFPLYNMNVYNGSLKNPYTNPRAPVHIISGAAGNREKIDHFLWLPKWSAFTSSDYGYGRMKVYNATHLHWEQVSDDKGGQVIDEIWLIKDRHGSYDPHIRLKPEPPEVAFRYVAKVELQKELKALKKGELP